MSAKRPIKPLSDKYRSKHTDRKGKQGKAKKQRAPDPASNSDSDESLTVISGQKSRATQKKSKGGNKCDPKKQAHKKSSAKIGVLTDIENRLYKR